MPGSSPASAALGVRQPFAHQVVLGSEPRDEAGEHRRGLLAHQFRVVVLVEFVQLHQRPREPRLAADLPRAQRAEQVDDLGGTHAHGVETSRGGARARHRRQAPVARMRAGQVVGHAPPEPVELDAGADDVARGQVPVQSGRQVLGLEHLQLQTHRQTVLGTAPAQAHQRLAAFQHRAAGERLQAVEVGESCGVGLLHPVPPQRVDGLAHGRISHHALRLDAGADGVGHEGLDARGRPGVAPGEIAALGAQFVLRESQRRDRPDRKSVV